MREPELTQFRLSQLEAGVPAATETVPGDMSASDKTKLDAYAATPGTNQGEIQHVSIDVTLATLKTKTSGVAFNVGSALPTNAQLVAPVSINVIQLLAGGSVNAAHVTVQNTGETAGALLASTNVFTGAATGLVATAGSSPYPTRGGQQLQATVTVGVDTMANLTAGHFSIELFYAVVP